MIQKRADGPTWQQSWRQKARWDGRWELGMMREYLGIFHQVDVEKLAKTAQKEWRGVRKAKDTPDPGDVQETIQQQINQRAFENGALAAYISLSGSEGEDSGQYTLDALGIGKTFSWAGARDFPSNTFAARGSKIISNIYHNHLQRLARMVVEKANPAQPKTIGQLTREIKKEWPRIARKDAARVARTESAFVWETTNYNALAFNGVDEVEWLIARGPNIGPPNSFEVCPRCLKMAAGSPYKLKDMLEIPPIHPNDRCTIVPKFDPNWLPPAEPWTGAAVKMQVWDL
jgi:hypothetical protein